MAIGEPLIAHPATPTASSKSTRKASMSSCRIILGCCGGSPWTLWLGQLLAECDAGSPGSLPAGPVAMSQKVLILLMVLVLLGSVEGMDELLEW